MNDSPISDAEIEKEISEKGLTAPRLTETAIRKSIVSTRYWQPEGATLTVCALVLANGFHVVGKSACVSPENFDAELGRKIAYQDAFSQCWELLGFLLASDQTGFQIPA